MKILVTHLSFDKVKEVHSDCVPRVGDRVDLFYVPCPVVTDVIWYPKETFGISDVDVIVTVE